MFIYRYKVFVAHSFGQILRNGAIAIVAVVTIVSQDWCLSTNEDVSGLREGECQQQNMTRRERASTHLPASSSENLAAIWRHKQEAVEGVHLIVWRKAAPGRRRVVGAAWGASAIGSCWRKRQVEQDRVRSRVQRVAFSPNRLEVLDDCSDQAPDRYTVGRCVGARTGAGSRGEEIGLRRSSVWSRGTMRQSR